MKEEHLSYRFKSFQSQNPNLGDYIVLSMSVRGMKYNKWKVYEAFNKYVPKNDYAKNERDMLMENLVNVTNQGVPKIINSIAKNTA